MAEYDNSNSGALFENEKKQNAKHPDLRGSCTIKMPNGDNVEYWVSAWQKVSKKGDDFFSLSFQVKEDKQEAEETTVKKSGGLFKKREEPSAKFAKSNEDLDDSIPF